MGTGGKLVHPHSEISIDVKRVFTLGSQEKSSGLK